MHRSLIGKVAMQNQVKLATKDVGKLHFDDDHCHYEGDHCVYRWPPEAANQKTI